MSTKKINGFYLAAIVLLIILIINRLDIRFWDGGANSDDRQYSAEKLNKTIQYIDRLYVEDVDWKAATEGAIGGLLETLDPHSAYIPPEKVKTNEENFNARYEGIGVQFDVIQHYPTIIAVIPGSPSEKLGLRAGDQFIKIEGESTYDIKMTEVPRKLKGPKGSEVKVTIKRPTIEDPFDVVIERDEIPIYTIHTHFKVNEKTGYIWLNRFAHTTADEMEEAILQLEKQGMEQLILDLRGNGGGFLKQAVQIVGMFIEGHKKVVYTKGRLSRFNNAFYTDDFEQPLVRNYPLIVLIDGSSASASEIVAGAIQDYDRGLIVGTNSFGKGLVQNEFKFSDGSRLRLTVSRYYTPSGRLIQKPYKDKDVEQYYHDGINPPQADTTITPPSDTTNKKIFYTENGREVYGGGGIAPDIEVKYQIKYKNEKVFQAMMQKRLFFKAAADRLRQSSLRDDNFERFKAAFQPDRRYIQSLKKLAAENEIQLTDQILEEDRAIIKNRLKAEVARNLWGMSEYYQVILQSDNQFNKAIKLFTEINKLLAVKGNEKNEK
ncbi:MAG: PDZ domain-containing protein [Caldithrix sp.]|nr:PDZ domain-containing protein [Caldithrix sp.]